VHDLPVAVDGFNPEPICQNADSTIVDELQD
jgi:hypothetical protein